MAVWSGLIASVGWAVSGESGVRSHMTSSWNRGFSDDLSACVVVVVVVAYLTRTFLVDEIDKFLSVVLIIVDNSRRQK